MAEYRLSPAAEHDLENIWHRYTCRQWSVGQAEHYIDMLSAAFGELASSPMIASACDHIRPGYHRHNGGDLRGHANGLAYKNVRFVS